MPLLRRLADRYRRPADRRFGVRLLGAAAVTALGAVPFGLLVVLVETKWQPLHRVDAGAAGRLNRVALDHPAWTSTLRLLSDHVWDPVTLRLAVAALTCWLLYRRAWRLAAWSGVTAVAGGLVGLLVKLAVERARPAFQDPVAHAPGYSFPSGHAMTATTSFAVLVLVLLPFVPRAWRPVCWAVGIVSVIGVCFTRVALGVHWFSDVVGGCLLGLVVVAATAWAFRSWRTDTGHAGEALADGLEPEITDAHPEPDPHESRPARG
ncbi:phosphatase PAP2 family protein [Streptomyces sp. NEAU-H3]|uniref:phosphatase PAP2 family protein n=1 Tax=unclassified Streptomyces TaxID=2593676 RepID=UPI00143C7E1A|nr:phosphatase PAP2 family protein [Streptomyces sp. NEAU-H3]NJA57989.1 phosphatase PAP2 family protein [Streptomyces sp. NEAU-H3]